MVFNDEIEEGRVVYDWDVMRVEGVREDFDDVGLEEWCLGNGVEEEGDEDEVDNDFVSSIVLSVCECISEGSLDDVGY